MGAEFLRDGTDRFRKKTCLGAGPAGEARRGEKTPESSPPPEAPPERSFLEKIIQKIAPADTFSRTYPVDFASFHPKANSALQDYARTRKGNSFQISRLGSDEVVLRGVYVREGTQERYSATLTVKPAGPQKSQLEIKVTPAAEFLSCFIFGRSPACFLPKFRANRLF
ncbi:MAG: hypothetical protein NTV04_22935 [Deltaproteobacteria bacterium]|nr:hypothetical protein [Deltaproteobacteria bacterium]